LSIEYCLLSLASGLIAKNLKFWQNLIYMKCPHCKTTLEPQKIGSVVYWACPKCHALWFDNKENDFLTLEETNKLQAKYNKNSLTKEEYSCPRCNKIMSNNLTYHHCYNCGGVLYESDNLVEETLTKTNKYTAKIKNTIKPLQFGQLKSVVIVVGLLVFVSLNVSIFNKLGKKTTIQSQASAIKKQLRFQSVGNNKMAVFFTTEEPFISTALFSNSSSNWTVEINKEPSVTHFLLFEQPNEATQVKVELKSLKNEKIETETIAIPQYQN
jgi:Zn-finger nucleic acid-binding protein